MSNTFPRAADRLDALLALWSDQQLSEAEWAELREFLSSDPSAVDRYLDYVRMHALLEVELGWQGAIQNHGIDLLEEIGRHAVPPPSLSDAMILPAISDEPDDDDSEPLTAPHFPKSNKSNASVKTTRAKTSKRPWFLAASLLIAGTIAVFISLEVLKHRSAAQDVAILTGAIDARWSDDSGQWTSGSVLPAEQKLSLESGWAELAYPSGVVVTIEGPAIFSVNPGRVLALDSGKVTAFVPQAGHGFTVRTASAVVVDLGTEFGVATYPDGKSDVQVFRGRVTLAPTTGADGKPASGTPLQMSEGDTFRVTADGAITPTQLADAVFVRQQQFTAWVQADKATPYTRWKAFSERLQRDPTLIAYYTFENQGSAPDRLVNSASTGSALDGILGGGQPNAVPGWTSGRWPGKGALQFHAREPEHVTIPPTPELDFSHGDLTASPFSMVMWAKGTGEADSAVIARGHAAAEQYAFGAQSENFRIWVRDQRPVVRSGTNYDLSCGSDTDGKWHEVVATYDPINLKITLYVDGKECAAMKAPAKLLETAEEIRIGSRQGLPGDNPVNFDGSVDEIAIFRRVLSANEVGAIYDAGKPD